MLLTLILLKNDYNLSLDDLLKSVDLSVRISETTHKFCYSYSL